MRIRQRKLFDSCFQLLGEIRDMGGENHETIRAAVMEQLADTSLARLKCILSLCNLTRT